MYVYDTKCSQRDSKRGQVDCGMEDSDNGWPNRRPGQLLENLNTLFLIWSPGNIVLMSQQFKQKLQPKSIHIYRALYSAQAGLKDNHNIHVHAILPGFPDQVNLVFIINKWSKNIKNIIEFRKTFIFKYKTIKLIYIC